MLFAALASDRIGANLWPGSESRGPTNRYATKAFSCQDIPLRLNPAINQAN